MNKKTRFNLILWVTITLILVVILIGGYLLLKGSNFHFSDVINDNKTGQISIDLEGQSILGSLTQQSVIFQIEQATVNQQVSFTDVVKSTSSFGICGYSIDILKNGAILSSNQKLFGTPLPSSTFKETLSFTPTSEGTYTAQTYYYLPSPTGQCYGGYGTKQEGSQNTVTVKSQQQCTPSWQCLDWSQCTSGSQSRTCSDSSNCGIGSGKPGESQSCTSDGGTGSCPSGQTLCSDGTCAITCGGGSSGDKCYFIVNNQCTEGTCGSLNLTSYGDLAKCQQVVNPKTDYLLYIIAGIVTILFIFMIFLVIKRFRK